MYNIVIISNPPVEVSFSGGKVIDATEKLKKLVENILSDFDNYPQDSDVLYQLIDKVINRDFSIQTVRLESVRVYDEYVITETRR